MNMKQRAMCLRILDHYGVENQAKQTIEECGELIVALRHYERGKCDKAAVIDEIADIIVMGEQMRHVFGYAAVEARVDEKLERKIQEIQAEPPTPHLYYLRAEEENREGEGDRLLCCARNDEEGGQDE